MPGRQHSEGEAQAVREPGALRPEQSGFVYFFFFHFFFFF